MTTVCVPVFEPLRVKVGEFNVLLASLVKDKTSLTATEFVPSYAFVAGEEAVTVIGVK